MEGPCIGNRKPLLGLYATYQSVGENDTSISLGPPAHPISSIIVHENRQNQPVGLDAFSEDDQGSSDHGSDFFGHAMGVDGEDIADPPANLAPSQNAIDSFFRFLCGWFSYGY